MLLWFVAALMEFLSTPSARRATSRRDTSSGYPANFYPRPPRGGRLIFYSYEMHVAEFLSTPSARRATLSSCSLSRTTEISIHALREEGDRAVPAVYGPDAGFLSTPSARRATAVHHCNYIRLDYFYPRPPRGGRLLPVYFVLDRYRFLSTPSARRAT